MYIFEVSLIAMLYELIYLNPFGSANCNIYRIQFPQICLQEAQIHFTLAKTRTKPNYIMNKDLSLKHGLNALCSLMMQILRELYRTKFDITVTLKLTMYNRSQCCAGWKDEQLQNMTLSRR
jgi:hypothetical protein